MYFESDEERAAKKLLEAEAKKSRDDADRARYLESRLVILRAIKRTGWYWPGED